MSFDYDLHVSRATNRLITAYPFYASILLKRPIQLSDTFPTACMDIRGQITLGKQFIEDKTTPQMVFLLAHECMHYMLSHCVRCGARNKAKYNWAADAFINETLIRDGVGDFIDGGVRHPGAEDMSADQLYPLAPDQPEGGGGGSLGSDLDTSGTESMTEAEIATAEAQAKQEIAQAAQSAKAMGKLSSRMERFVKDMLHKPVPWYRHLEQFFTRLAENDYDFTRPDRRFMHERLYIPGLGGYGSGGIVLVLDESGSISDAELAHFSKHFNDILQSCQPEELHVLHTTTRVEEAETFTADQFPIELTAKATGGTHMPAGVEYAMEHYPDAEAVVVLTDGYTDFGSTISIPVLWGITTAGIEAPHGQTIHININE